VWLQTITETNVTGCNKPPIYPLADQPPKAKAPAVTASGENPLNSDEQRAMKNYFK
jgi:hypothetical protein